MLKVLLMEVAGYHDGEWQPAHARGEPLPAWPGVERMKEGLNTSANVSRCGVRRAIHRVRTAGDSSAAEAGRR